MSGERRLRALLAGMSPRLSEGEYVFCTVPPEKFEALQLEPLATFREAEGISVVLDRPAADAAQLAYDYVARMIALEVHSDMSAVGFLAAIANRLTEAGISLNPIAATFHDYLFVPADEADDTVRLLKEMMREAGSKHDVA